MGLILCFWSNTIMWWGNYKIHVHCHLEDKVIWRRPNKGIFYGLHGAQFVKLWIVIGHTSKFSHIYKLINHILRLSMLRLSCVVLYIQCIDCWCGQKIGEINVWLCNVLLYINIISNNRWIYFFRMSSKLLCESLKYKVHCVWK